MLLLTAYYWSAKDTFTTKDTKITRERQKKNFSGECLTEAVSSKPSGLPVFRLPDNFILNIDYRINMLRPCKGLRGFVYSDTRAFGCLQRSPETPFLLPPGFFPLPTDHYPLTTTH